MPRTTRRIEGKLWVVRWHKDDKIASLEAMCPACDFVHSFNVDIEGHGLWPDDRRWSFNGDFDNPTFSPSMGANLHKTDEHHPVCHSFLENGKWRYLNDSTHDMAGQTVEVPDPNPDFNFQRRHGWHLYPHYDGPMLISEEK